MHWPCEHPSPTTPYPNQGNLNQNYTGCSPHRCSLGSSHNLPRCVLGVYNGCSKLVSRSLLAIIAPFLAQFLWITLTKLFSISDLTLGISVGLFILFVGMAIYIYKPRKRSVRGLYTAVDQPMPVWIIQDTRHCPYWLNRMRFQLGVGTHEDAFLLWTLGIQNW